MFLIGKWLSFDEKASSRERSNNPWPYKFCTTNDKKATKLVGRSSSSIPTSSHHFTTACREWDKDRTIARSVHQSLSYFLPERCLQPTSCTSSTRCTVIQLARKHTTALCRSNFPRKDKERARNANKWLWSSELV